MGKGRQWWRGCGRGEVGPRPSPLQPQQPPDITSATTTTATSTSTSPAPTHLSPSARTHQHLCHDPRPTSYSTPLYLHSASTILSFPPTFTSCSHLHHHHHRHFRSHAHLHLLNPTPRLHPHRSPPPTFTPLPRFLHHPNPSSVPTAALVGMVARSCVRLS